MVVFGLLFGASGFAGGISGAVTGIAFGLLVASIGLSIATARVMVTTERLDYRYGLRRACVVADQITSVEVGPGKGAGYARLAIIVGRAEDRPLRLTALQSSTSAAARQRLEGQAEEIRSVVGARVRADR